MAKRKAFDETIAESDSDEEVVSIDESSSDEDVWRYRPS